MVQSLNSATQSSDHFFCLFAVPSKSEEISFDSWWMVMQFSNTGMVHMCNALIDLNARRYTLIPAIEELITGAMKKIKSRFSEVDFYLGYSVA